MSHLDSDGNGNDDPFTSQDYYDALDDVHTRFILNLPEGELQSSDRIFFQVEQAWWFYQDFIVDKNPDQNLPSFKSLRPFAQQLFEYSQILPSQKFQHMWAQFSKYKQKISNYGCILLSQDCSKIVLCRTWDGKSYTFPAGKINQGENGVDAAARETYEETGFDPNCIFGVTAAWKASSVDKITWKSPLQEEDSLSFQEDYGKMRTCYVCQGVPLDYPFEPVARKEVSNVQFYDLENLPKNIYAVRPFLSQLKQWIRRRNGKKSNKKSRERAVTSQKKTRDSSRKGSRGRVARSEDDVVQAGLVSAGDVSGWSEDDMFATNARLLGRSIEYDGNPHVFEQGFGGQDPHAFHVVQGGFLNAGEGIQHLAPAPDTSKLQPLFSKNTGELLSDELEPFFGAAGETPFGDVVAEARTVDPPPTNTGKKKKRSKVPSSTKKNNESVPTVQLLTRASSEKALLLTDREITAKRQERHHQNSSEEEFEKQYERDMEFIRQWAARLPRPPPSKLFGEFRLQTDAILAAAGLSDLA